MFKSFQKKQNKITQIFCFRFSFHSNQANPNPYFTINKTPYQFKKIQDLKMLYYNNKLEYSQHVNSLVDLYDQMFNSIKKGPEGKKFSIEDIKGVLLEILKRISDNHSGLTFLSILKILNQASSPLLSGHQELQKELSQLTLDLIRKFSFHTEIFKQVEKADMFLQLIIRLVKLNKLLKFNLTQEEQTKMSNFCFNLLGHYKDFNFNLTKYSTKDLKSLCWVLGKIRIRHYDLFFDITEELKNRVKYLSLKDLITVLWSNVKLSMYDFPLVKELNDKINDLYVDGNKLDKELSKLDELFFLNLVEYLGSIKPLVYFSDDIVYYFKSKIEKALENPHTPVQNVLIYLSFFLSIGDENMIEYLKEDLETCLLDESHLVPLMTMALNYPELTDWKRIREAVQHYINYNREKIEPKTYLHVSWLYLKQGYSNLPILTESVIRYLIIDVNRVEEVINLMNVLLLENKGLFDEMISIASLEMNAYLEENLEDLQHEISLNILTLCHFLGIKIDEDKKSVLTKNLEKTAKSILKLIHKMYLNSIGVSNLFYPRDFDTFGYLNNQFIQHFKTVKSSIFIERNKVIKGNLKMNIYIPSMRIGVLFIKSNYGYTIIDDTIKDINFESFTENILYRNLKEQILKENGITLLTFPAEIFSDTSANLSPVFEELVNVCKEEHNKLNKLNLI